MKDSMQFSRNWNALASRDLPNNIINELNKETPDKQILIQSLRSKFDEVSERVSVDDYDFMQWMQFQSENSQLPLFFRRWLRLQPVVHVNFSSKINSIAQRHCRICEGATDRHSTFPVFILPIRIRGRSRQSLSANQFLDYQSAIRRHFTRRAIALPHEGGFCLTLTYIINQNYRDRDIDNMSKAFIDAFSRALSFDDARIHHLNACKLRFQYSEEYLYARLQPSHLNSDGHLDVAVPMHHSSWAGQNRLD